MSDSVLSSEVDRMPRQKVPFIQLYKDAAKLRYRNTPRKGGMSELVLDVAFISYSIITVLGSALRFLEHLPFTVMGVPLDNPVLRITLAALVGYASLVQVLWLFKVMAWTLRQE